MTMMVHRSRTASIRQDTLQLNNQWREIRGQGIAHSAKVDFEIGVNEAMSHSDNVAPGHVRVFCSYLGADFGRRPRQ